MIAKTVALIALFGIAGLSTPLFGLVSDHPTASVDASAVSQAKAVGTETLSGCLTTDNNSGKFFLRDADSNRLVEVVSSEDLAAYVGKHVKLTGTLQDAGGKKILQVTKIVVLGQSCRPGGN